MRTHTNDFKTHISQPGRKINVKITYDNVILTGDDLFSITPITNSDLFKTVMKELDFNSKVQIPKDTVINFEFGLEVNNEIEYINFGNYIVYESVWNVETNSYEHICYDNMLKTMIEYEALDITYPISVKNYINEVAQKCNLEFANIDETFVNDDTLINQDYFNKTSYTFRDILDFLSQIVAGWFYIDENNKLSIKYATETNETFNEDFLRSINIQFSKKYGEINSLVFSRSAESDNIFRQDEESVEQNGLTEIKFIDNPFLNENDRVNYIDEIFEKINGLYFYLMDVDSTGIVYLEVGDFYNFSINNTNYKCLLLNNELKISQGLKENIYTEEPAITQTDYTKADKTDQKINQTYLIVDKQNQTITQLISQTSEQEQKITEVLTTVDGLNIAVSNQQNQINETNDNIEEVRTIQNEMNYNFNTDRLEISKKDNPNSAEFSNTGMKLYNFDDLKLISNQNGTGVQKLIVTGDAQIGYLRFVKETDDNSNPCTDIHHLVSNIEELEDMEAID